ncbi:hypothetical protein [Bacillus vallismortis]|uniref:hypothetical protein n=1 Tax=Bacillus vallismortis TaxID=72361 RepID=UPI002282C068|nr:hypothetical protein [Bacillus vallismortis]MCY8533751.1 hypothetical protein [Bacillus vallismortis]MCY8544298.1 hypothetical protein [Bacillus vallismortis]
MGLAGKLLLYGLTRKEKNFAIFRGSFSNGENFFGKTPKHLQKTADIWIEGRTMCSILSKKALYMKGFEGILYEGST